MTPEERQRMLTVRLDMCQKVKYLFELLAGHMILWSVDKEHTHPLIRAVRETEHGF